MKITAFRFFSLFIVILFGRFTESFGQFSLDLESGLVFSSPYNEVRVPGITGTTLNLAKDLQTQQTLFYRVRASYTLAKRHTVSVLAAPLSVKSKGVLTKEVTYNGQLFRSGDNLEGTFVFNTYRLTYRYAIIHTNRFRLGVGLTGLLRDATVRLKSETQNAAFDNVGLVPLLHYHLWWNPARRLLILSEADGSYSTFGQAFDVFAGAAYRFTPVVAVKAGYRVIEGGTNGDDAYTSTWLNFASVGLVFTPGERAQ
jgi:hypothetical protein